MVKITSKEELEEWLKYKPQDWGQVIAVRTALRVAPIAMNDIIIFGEPDIIQAIWRCIFISWAARNFSAYDMKAAADAAAAAAAYAPTAAVYAADAVAVAVRFTALAARFTALAIASDAARADVRVAAAAANAADAAYAAADAADAADAFAAAIWQSINADAQWLDSHPTQSAQQLTHQPLWLENKAPDIILKAWNEAKPILIDLDKNYLSWIDLYERRLRGEEAAFDIPHDKDRTEDKEILKKIADATDENFWDKGAEYVSQQLSDWLSEARERAQERYDAENSVSDDIDTEISIPNQNTNAITFHRGETGKIAVNQTASSDEILKDADSVERHQLTLEDALEIRRKCETSNAGARLTQLLENYINSIGQSLEEIKPSMTVQRGEKLRQELAAYDRHDNMLAPISDEILLDLKSWQSAHNMMVGLQPKLNALDTSMLGPDRQPAEFTPDDLRKLANDAENLELIEVSTKEILDETVDQADGVKDYKDRKFVWSAETAKNLVIEAINIAKDKPKTAITSVTTIAVGVSNPSASIPLAIIAARFLIKNRNWVESKMGNAQTWKSLFSHLCDKYDGIINFDKNSP